VRAVVHDGPGGPDVLRWGEAPDPPCGPGQVALAVRATAVNRADLLQRRGLYPPPPGASEVLGLEAAGVVAEVGAGVEGAAEGDAVMALLPGGGYAERAVVDARHALPVPRAVGLPDAGGVMETFLTAHLNLLDTGGLAAGERVLIHGAGGGVGTAAIQLASRAGAEVWVTTGSEAKRALATDLGAAVVLDYRQDDFAARLAGAGGADLILDVVGAKYLEPNLRALAPDGRLVVIGLQGGARTELSLGRLLARRLRVIGSTLRGLDPDRKAALVARFRERTWPLLDDGALRVVVDRRLPLTEAAAAHRLVEEYGHTGKVILTLEPLG